MNFSRSSKRVIAAIFAPILICILCMMLSACTLDLKYDEAIAIAKSDFGCEKILWIKSGALILNDERDDGVYDLRSHYAFYVVGEKNGEEVYIIVPSDPQLEKPFLATWCLDFSFTQIVEKFNECDAQYFAEVPDDYYSVNASSYIDLRAGNSLKGLAEYYGVGGDDETFYARLDVKAVFEYVWDADGCQRRCIVTQENGELKAYTTTIAL